MSILSSLKAELQHEAIATRKVLERVPMDKLSWKPHEKSMALGSLAKHVAELPSLITMGMTKNEWEVSENKPTPMPTTNAELVELFDKHVKEASDSLEKENENEFLGQSWSMRNKEQIFFTIPRFAVLRNMGMNHLIHHRAQLAVYLRLLNIPVPGIYGPTADER
jgi:uncharacterized damage-inducible protein DinB